MRRFDVGAFSPIITGFAGRRHLYRLLLLSTMTRDHLRQYARALQLACLFLITAAGVAQAADPAPTQPVAQALQKLVQSGNVPALQGPGRELKESLERFYAPTAYVPVWFDGSKAKPTAQQVLTLLKSAESHGLDGAVYDVTNLEKRLATASSTADVAEVEAGLSASLFRFLTELHSGRLSPRQVDFAIGLTPKKLDLPTLVRQNLTADGLTKLVPAAVPRNPMYERLRKGLAQYQELARNNSFKALPVVKKVEPDQPYAGIADLTRLLIATGDLPAGTPVPKTYSGAVVDGMKRFQARHGLLADGVIGKPSFDQLNVPFTQRVRQLELALERTRWVAPPADGRMIAVNIPEFRLAAVDVKDGSPQTRFYINVIVGRAAATQTPIFNENMRYIEFHPYWNVPAKIAQKEYLPKFRREPNALSKENMELVGHDGVVTTAINEETLAALSRGAMRVRQRPGGRNALGDIKFVFPNKDDIYLHHTPSVGLFKRARRDFSHGCIRVQEPVKLARFVLEDKPEWSEDKIKAAMAGKHSTLNLSKPIPVVIFYNTAAVDEEGKVMFFTDIYGLDRKLDALLKGGQRS